MTSLDATDRRLASVATQEKDRQASQGLATLTANKYSAATKQSKSDRGVSHDAVTVLEDALAAPTPKQGSIWHLEVIAALDAFIMALDSQADSDLDDQSLLSEIAADNPHLVPRIQQLHSEHKDLRETAAALLDQIGGREDHDCGDVHDFDVADIRNRLSSLGRHYRQHRMSESDLVYEAINVDLGASD